VCARLQVHPACAGAAGLNESIRFDESAIAQQTACLLVHTRQQRPRPRLTPPLLPPPVGTAGNGGGATSTVCAAALSPGYSAYAPSKVAGLVAAANSTSLGRNDFALVPAARRRREQPCGRRDRGSGRAMP
jgi:hypothetical protein